MVQLHRLFAANCEKDGFRTLILKPWIHGDLIRTQKTPWPSYIFAVPVNYIKSNRQSSVKEVCAIIIMNPFRRQETIESRTSVWQNVTLKTYLGKVEIFWDFVWFKFSSPDMKIPFGSKIVDQCSYYNKYSNRIDCPNIIYSFKVTKMFKFLSPDGESYLS